MILFALFGLCIGSFLGVVIYRLPRRQSVVRPGSRCPACRHALAWYDLIPLLSFAARRGRCGYCGSSIPLRYPGIEVATALVFLLLFYRYGWTPLLARHTVLAALLIVATEVDRRERIIPNQLVAMGLVLGSVLLAIVEPVALVPSSLAALASGGALLMLREGSRLVFTHPGFGMGDVKLAAMTGLYLGWYTLWVLYLAIALGGAIGLYGLFIGRLTRTTRLPFAPLVAVATGLHLLLPIYPCILIP